MSHVVDTNVVSALVRSDPIASRRLLALPPSQIYLPHPVVAEIRYGLERLPRSRRRTTLERRCEELFSALQRVEWTDDVSLCFGTIKADLERIGARIDDFDVAIAAHAVALGAVLATANTRHFGRISGLQVEDWTKAP